MFVTSNTAPCSSLTKSSSLEDPFPLTKALVLLSKNLFFQSRIKLGKKGLQEYIYLRNAFFLQTWVEHPRKHKKKQQGENGSLSEFPFLEPGPAKSYSLIMAEGSCNK